MSCVLSVDPTVSEYASAASYATPRTRNRGKNVLQQRESRCDLITPRAAAAPPSGAAPGRCRPSEAHSKSRSSSLGRPGPDRRRSRREQRL